VESTGIKQTVYSPTSISESHASAIYFADELKASTKYGTICIDIGGGTSDVAIWQDDELRYQVSLRIAGRDIFLNTLNAKPEFLEQFGVNISILNTLVNNRIKFYAQADALISRKGKEWLLNLPTKAGDEILKLTQIIAIGLSGLFYYIGLVLRHLMEKNNYKREMPEFFVGGNGSNLFHWLASGFYSDQSPINELLRDVFHEASGLKQDGKNLIKIILSPEPKSETARGLVGQKQLQFARAAVNDSTVISGENFLYNGQNYDHNSIITASMFKDSLEPTAKLEKTESFIKIFNNYASKTNIPSINIDLISNELRKRVGGRLKDLSKKNPKKISVEPIFILALKELLEISVEEWKHK
jgi:hypothetical protein